MLVPHLDLQLLEGKISVFSVLVPLEPTELQLTKKVLDKGKANGYRGQDH